MKRVASVPEAILLGSSCSKLALRVAAAYRMWAELESSLRSCFVKVAGSPSPSLDPFELMRVLTALRLRAEAVEHVGESLIEETERQVRLDVEAATRTFDAELRQLCANHQVAVTGRFPNYSLDRFLTLQLDLERQVSRIGSKTLKSFLIGRVWLLVTDEIQAEKRRRVRPEDLLSICENAYKRVIEVRGESIGTPVPIRELLRELQASGERSDPAGDSRPKRAVSYTEEYFKRDLAGLIAAGIFVSGTGTRMELFPTAFPKEGIPIGGAEGVRYIGRVSFGKPER